MELLEAIKTLKEHCTGKNCWECELRENPKFSSGSMCYLRNHNPAVYEIIEPVVEVPRLFK